MPVPDLFRETAEKRAVREKGCAGLKDGQKDGQKEARKAAPGDGPGVGRKDGRKKLREQGTRAARDVPAGCPALERAPGNIATQGKPQKAPEGKKKPQVPVTEAAGFRGA